MSRYILAPSAKQDLKESNSYLVRFSPATARRFKDRSRKQCKLLADFPEIGRSCNNLQAKLKSFPMENYLIFYRPMASGIEIVRIVSGYRDLEVLFASEENI